MNQGVLETLVGTAEVRADPILGAHGARLREQAGEPRQRAHARNLSGPLIDRVLLGRPVDPGDRLAALVLAAEFDVLRLEFSAVGSGLGSVLRLGLATAVQVAAGLGTSRSRAFPSVVGDSSWFLCAACCARGFGIRGGADPPRAHLRRCPANCRSRHASPQTWQWSPAVRTLIPASVSEPAYPDASHPCTQREDSIKRLAIATCELLHSSP